MIRIRVLFILPVMMFAVAGVTIGIGADINVLKNSATLERLLKQTGVYNTSSTGKTPAFVVDAAWPQPLPNHWLLGQIGGLYVDQHDHVWVYNRPRTLATEEAGLEGPLPGATDGNGVPIKRDRPGTSLWSGRRLLQIRSFCSGI
jgi:hypothetical protein